MKTFFLLSALACLSAATHDVRARFREAMDKYAVQDQVNLAESPEVLKARLKSFMEFDTRVQEINADDSRLFTAEDNFLSILTPEERAGRLGLNITGHKETEPTGLSSTLNAGELPATRDFSGVISNIKDQGWCGSCWTFGAATALEGEIYFKTGDRSVSLSEQEWLECATSSERDGCRGGWPEWCYHYSRRTGRIAPTSAYPYRGSDPGCDAQAMEKQGNALADHNVRVAGDIRIEKGSLLRYASEHIISVCIYANSDFMSYRDGVYMDNDCQKWPNHAVGVVGYGTKWNRPYWKIRNSWGRRWGDNGYILMDRQLHDMCSVESYAHIPDVQCRDNTCVAPNPDEGDSGERATVEPPHVCYKTLNFGFCRWSRNRALWDCTNSGIPKQNCYVAKWRSNCYVATVDSTTTHVSGSRVQFPVPCEGEKEKPYRECWKSHPLATCKSSPEEAIKACVSSGIRRRECLFVEWTNNCYKPIVATGGTSTRIEYYVSCDRDEECDADAGLVFCSDCKCCKHKHFCHDSDH